MKVFIIVDSTDQEVVIDADDFKNGENGQLTILKNNEVVAVFNTGCWISIRTEERPDTEATITISDKANKIGQDKAPYEQPYQHPWVIQPPYQPRDPYRYPYITYTDTGRFVD